jgi:ATP adenylyltransferase
MEFYALLDFIQTRMRMSHIYQPSMIRTLLDHQGEADDEQIAKYLLSPDRSQIEYYQQITRNMVGRILRGHDVVEKEGRKYWLVGFDKFTPAQIEALREACDEKTLTLMDSMSESMWGKTPGRR